MRHLNTKMDEQTTRKPKKDGRKTIGIVVSEAALKRLECKANGLGMERNEMIRQILYGGCLQGRDGGKQTVLGMRERGGKSVALVVEDRKASTLQAAIAEYVEAGSMIHTDEHAAYRGMGDAYEHEAVHHGSKKYVRYVGASRPDMARQSVLPDLFGQAHFRLCASHGMKGTH